MEVATLTTATRQFQLSLEYSVRACCHSLCTDGLNLGKSHNKQFNEYRPMHILFMLVKLYIILLFIFIILIEMSKDDYKKAVHHVKYCPRGGKFLPKRVYCCKDVMCSPI